MSSKNPDKIENYQQQLKALKSIDRRLQKQVELVHQFKSGIYRGIGFAIGASIIGAIIVATLVSIFDNIDNPFVQDVINASEATNSSSVRDFQDAANQ